MTRDRAKRERGRFDEYLMNNKKGAGGARARDEGSDGGADLPSIHAKNRAKGIRWLSCLERALRIRVIVSR